MRRFALPLAIAAALGFPAGAQAAAGLETSIMDDDVLLAANAQQAAASMKLFKTLGVDRVRVSAFWNKLAPSPRGKTRPANFDPANPFSRGYTWAPLDRVVVSAAQAGLRVMISITTPAPYWGTATPTRRNPVWKPRGDEFAAFAAAVATRYADYADQFAIMNEPNQGAWLQPQSDKKGTYSPHHYRSLVLAAFPRIRAAAPDAQVLIGELAPSGIDERGTTRPIRPLTFLRAMGCATSRFKAIRSGRCAGFQPVPGDALGHHPYNFFQPPSRRSFDRNDAAIGDTPRLLSTLDSLTRAKRLAPQRTAKFDVYFTEFGYQTDPPDPISGISLARQTQWLAEAAWRSWRLPRVRGINQFQLIDGRLRAAKGRERYAGFQSGLIFESGRHKPAFSAFPRPFVVSDRTPRKGSRMTLWGMVRSGGQTQVTIERRSSRRADWRTVLSVTTGTDGSFTHRVPARSGDYRFIGGGGRSAFVTVKARS